jgi:ATP-dependent DNA helicase RecG
VTMNRSELLSPAVRAWIAGLDARLPTPAHEIALAMLRDGYVTNAMLRQWGVDRITAGQVVRDLVDQGLAIKEGGRRYAQYVLDPEVAHRETEPDLFAGLLPNVAEALRDAGEASAAELRGATGLARNTVINHVNELMAQGLAAAEGTPRSPKRRYRWTGPTARPDTPDSTPSREDAR